ncbi:MAG: hypothetical protein L0209_03420, partial [candidate division Zixibacteria bacterium]|nr:hypothetical protein [candidate division Zixibacteria bacterium]
MRPIHPLKRTVSAFFSVTLISILTAASARAQRDTLRIAAPSADRTPLEAAVDSNEYVVGPGDELTIPHSEESPSAPIHLTARSVRLPLLAQAHVQL